MALCNAAREHLRYNRPPTLLDGRRLTTLGPECRPLMREIRSCDFFAAGCLQRWGELDGEIMEILMHEDRNSRSEAKVDMLMAETALCFAEYYESVAAIRRLETKLWQRGIRILSPKVTATRYQAARVADPEFSTLCDDYTQLATRHGQLGEIRIELAGLHGQRVATEDKQDRVQAECERIMAQEGLE